MNVLQYIVVLFTYKLFYSVQFTHIHFTCYKSIEGIWFDVTNWNDLQIVIA